MLKKYNVFLDTQVFVSLVMDFEHHLFLKLKKLIEDEFVELYITEITKQEILDKIKNIENPKVDKMLKNSVAFKSFFDENTLEIAKNEIKDKFEDFLLDFNVKEIPIYEEVTKSVLKNYFEAKPPFSAKKKQEFPDAFVLLSLLNWANINTQSLIIVSNDIDMRTFCEQESRFIYEQSMKSMLDEVNKQKEKYQFALKLFLDQREVFLEYLNDSMADYSAELIIDVYDAEFTELKGWSVDEDEELSSDPLILEVEEDTFTISVDVDFNIDSLVISNIDPNLSPYDSEEKRYLYLEYEDKEINDLSLTLPVEFQITVNDYQKQEYSIDYIEINNGDEVNLTIDENI
ncbi:PIN domain-containing protein [Bacillus pumilus]|uniref:PIN domain-containing protein n=1 Tax=Bacillus pumilus TaxID=1408 RepID=UPI0011A698B3|nr:PIN domain-containing protein [Bacillus pumilus]